MASLARRWGPVAEDDLVLRDLTKIGSVSDVARTSARLSEVIREQCEGIRANVKRTDRSLALYNLLAAGTAGQAVDAARSDGQDHLAKVAIVDHDEVAQHVAADQRDDRRLLTSQVRADHKVEVDRGQAGSGEAEARRVLRLLLNAAGCSDVDGADRRNAELTHDGRLNGAHARARVDQAHTPNRGRWRGSLSTELMREDRMDIVILDANFDPLEQGVAFITREVRLLRPSERRRLFLVYVTSGVRTMDLHAAFLHNVNLVINPSDVEQLPEALEVSIRHYNDLYRPFNRALDIAPI